MAKVFEPERIKILFGLLYPNPDWLRKIQAAIEERWGRIDLRSEPFSFRYTDYYAQEMGTALLRSWCTIEQLTTPDRLADLKTWSNAIEDQWSTQGKRIVNIDPGYLSLPKLVLASAKDFGSSAARAGAAETTRTSARKAKRNKPIDTPSDFISRSRQG